MNVNDSGSGRRIAWLVASSGFSPEERQRRQDEIGGYAPRGLELELLTPEASPRFLSQPTDFGPAVASMVDLVSSLDPERYSVGVLAGAIDPGLDEIRSGSAVPIVGPFEATLRVVETLGRPVTILTSDAVIAGATRDKLASQYPDAQVCSVRHIGVSVAEIAGMMDDPRALDEVRRSIVAQGRAAIEEDGAAAFQFGCMTFATLGVRDPLIAELGLPVLDPARISVTVAGLIATVDEPFVLESAL
ncbi:aspartate/glutamate racemase family protein [Compostimonas suwonensis]|uniref:Asp/Glu/hydantoin racemase n=1 Tax=Compostimonas suwonensis TaxID=1048394 RepID=A0A2M9C3I4_9MICO|nr:aspartate/glutamate racemase family protein [Compostimonas suwonensis]PJJ65101.1 Asp/Glu/hydantoin racemase [Compostimonas suwonensis]